MTTEECDDVRETDSLAERFEEHRARLRAISTSRRCALTNGRARAHRGARARPSGARHQLLLASFVLLSLVVVVSPGPVILL